MNWFSFFLGAIGMMDTIFVYAIVDTVGKGTTIVRGLWTTHNLYRDFKPKIKSWIFSSLPNELFFNNNSLGYLISANTNHFQGTYDLDMKDFSNSSTGKVAKFLFLHLYKGLFVRKRFCWRLLYLNIPKISEWLCPEQPSVYDGIGKESIEGKNIICIGSPRNDDVAKHIFGYYNSLLPFGYVDGEDLGETRWRYIVGGRRDLKKYGITTRNIYGKEKYYYPSIGNSGFIESDYLLITKVPNPSDRTKDVIIFGGVHGTATESVALLFQDRGILESILEHTCKLGFYHFQTLIKVNKIEHCGKKGLSTPKSIEHIQTIALHV